MFSQVRREEDAAPAVTSIPKTYRISFRAALAFRCCHQPTVRQYKASLDKNPPMT